ncbi:MAG: NAD-dependent epimerase/dehydratase family protein, partial [Acidimicrobiales bacterium]
MASGTGLGPEVVVVTGGASALGRRVAALAAGDPAVGRVVALDRRLVAPPIPGVEAHTVDLAAGDLKTLLEGATSVVHLAEVSGPEAPEEEALGDGALARRVLDAASAVGAEHIVLLSSAIVYGAWANNPVPLTEDAPLRPNPGVVAAS